MPVTSVKLNNGLSIAQIGFGTWQAQPGQVEKAVEEAIQLGYRHIDCAYVYANEDEVGTAIKKKIADGTVKREDLFIVTKLWNTFHEPSRVKVGIETSLKKLGLTYLDLYLIHTPMGLQNNGELFPMENGKFLFYESDHIAIWKEMEKLVEQGLTKSIGVSNFNIKMIQNVLDNCKIKPVTNQVECHVYWPQYELAEFMKKNDIVLTAYSPLASPGTDGFAPINGKTDRVLDDQDLKKIGDKHGKSIAQVALRWLVQRGFTTIPKSVTASRIAANIDVFDFTLDADDLKTIEAISKGPKAGRRIHMPFFTDDAPQQNVSWKNGE